MTKTQYFKNSFFPYCVDEWNKLDSEVRRSFSISVFKNSLIKSIRPKSSPIYDIFDPEGLKLLTRLRTNLSHLREHKFRHNFRDTINPLCTCNIEIESTKHYLLRCSLFNDMRKTLLDNIIDIVGTIANLSEDNLVDLLLYGNDSLSLKDNMAVLKCTLSYLKSSKRFDEPLLQ